MFFASRRVEKPTDVIPRMGSDSPGDGGRHLDQILDRHRDERFDADKHV